MSLHVGDEQGPRSIEFPDLLHAWLSLQELFCWVLDGGSTSWALSPVLQKLACTILWSDVTPGHVQGTELGLQVLK